LSRLKEKAYLGLLDFQHNLQKSIHELKSINVEITGRCNLQCRHCYMCSSLSVEEDELGTEDWKVFFSEIKKDFGNNIGIRLTGGEIFSREDIFELLEFLKEKGFVVSVVSNGLLINEENVIKIKKLITGVSISLDGFEESHNYLRGGEFYKKTLESVALLKKNEIIPSIKTTVYRKNINELNDFYDFLKKMGIIQWQISPMEPLGWGEINKNDILEMAEYQRLCDFVDKIRNIKNNKVRLIFEEDSKANFFKKSSEVGKCKRCVAGITTFSVLHNGDITSCVQNQEKSDIIGNIKKDQVRKLWENSFKKNRQKSYKFCNKHHFINKLNAKINLSK
jgi:MoaA/NifB/PqqE/SkfB family radical SAM enzyme